MYISFNISMEFEIYGIKFKCEDGEMYRWKEFKKKSFWSKLNPTIDSGYYQFQFSYLNKSRKFKLHRIIYWLHNPDWDVFDSSKDNCIDHIDQNKLNNDITNLRVVTNQQNRWNVSGYKGTRFHKKSKSWQSRIMIDGKSKSLGYFKKEEDAHQAYLDAKKIYHII